MNCFNVYILCGGISQSNTRFGHFSFSYFTISTIFKRCALFLVSLGPNGQTDQTTYRHRMFYLSQSFPFHSSNLATLIFEFRTFIRLRKCAFSLTLSFSLSRCFVQCLRPHRISVCLSVSFDSKRFKITVKIKSKAEWISSASSPSLSPPFTIQILGKMGIAIEIACFIDKMLIGWNSSVSSLYCFTYLHLPLALTSSQNRFCPFPSSEKKFTWIQAIKNPISLAIWCTGMQ